MSQTIRNQKEILKKLNIEKLNTMQEEATYAIHSSNEIILLSPTGTGKTLAFLLPIIANCCHIFGFLFIENCSKLRECNTCVYYK